MGVSDTKIPLKLDGFPASPSDEDTWSSFDDVAKRIDSNFFDYSGFVFHNDGYVGIDIDKGFNEDGSISPLAYDIISHCKSYTELSKSGRGFHIIVKGMLDTPGMNNFNGVEIYSDKRYFVTTGKVFIYNKIIENQDSINYVLDNYFTLEANAEDSYKSDNIYPLKYSYQLKDGIFSFSPSFDTISEGGRHLSLVSAAGQLLTLGYDLNGIINRLSFINRHYCLPPLTDKEIVSIAKSIMKYERRKT